MEKTTASAATVHGRLDSSKIFAGTFHVRNRRLQHGKLEPKLKRNEKGAQRKRKRLADGGKMADEKVSKNARRLDFENASKFTDWNVGEAAEKVSVYDWA